MDVGHNNTWFSRKPSRTVVVFVHGVISTAKSCWTHVKTNSFWPRLVRDDPQFEDPAIFLSGYDSNVRSGRFDAQDAADQVYQSLCTADRPPAPMSKPRMLFVCHSQGGIVVRRILCAHSDAFADKLVGLVLCGTPSWGSLWATLGGPLLRLLGHAQGWHLRHGDPLLVDLDRDFQRLMSNRKIPALVGTCLVETRGPCRLPWRIVPDATATRYFPWQRIGAVTHGGLVKPTSFGHASHVALRAFAVKHGFLMRGPFLTAARELREAMADVEAAFDPARPPASRHQKISSVARTRHAARDALDRVDSDDRLTTTPIDMLVRTRLDAGMDWAFYDLSREQFASLQRSLDALIREMEPRGC
jgi:hypothetical protein